jgi:hypothetical protein
MAIARVEAAASCGHPEKVVVLGGGRVEGTTLNSRKKARFKMLHSVSDLDVFFAIK